MGGEQAANTLAQVKLRQMERDGAPIDALIDKLKQDTQTDLEQLSAYYATSQIWDDGVLDPIDTRNALGVAITALMNAPLGEPGCGVFRF